MGMRLATSATARHLGRQSAGMRALLLAFLFLAAPALAESAEPVVRFTPGQDCTGLIVQQIQAARQSILVQAYSFTSVPILSALKAASRPRRGRGSDCRQDLGPGQQVRLALLGRHLSRQRGHPGLVDNKVAIAHNKVMVIDGATVITGSFNFTAAAQNSNAENLPGASMSRY